MATFPAVTPAERPRLHPILKRSAIALVVLALAAFWVEGRRQTVRMERLCGTEALQPEKWVDHGLLHRFSAYSRHPTVTYTTSTKTCVIRTSMLTGENPNAPSCVRPFEIRLLAQRDGTWKFLSTTPALCDPRRTWNG